VDQRLRELERRWLSSGATDDGAAWLAERLRREPGPPGEPDVGTPPPFEGLIGRGPPLTRLELERRASPGPAPAEALLPGPDDLRTRVAAAAHCGDPIACGALGGLAVPTDPLATWARGLAGKSREAAIAAALRATVLAFHQPAGVDWRACTFTDWRPIPVLAALHQLGGPSDEATIRLHEAADQAGAGERRLQYQALRAEERPLEERLAAARLSVAAGASRRACEVAYEPDPGRVLAEAISCAAIAVRGPLTSLRHAEAMFIALSAMQRDGPVFGPVGDANLLVLVRQAVSEWALRGLLPKNAP